MHYLMLVTLTMPVGASSQDARKQAETILAGDASFCGEGGRFGSPLADWFVIGGRWSGHLTKQLLGQPYQAAFEREFPELAAPSFAASLIEKHRTGLNRFWQRHGGRDVHPLNRSGYDYLGSDDDAMLVGQVLYDRLLAEFAGESSYLASGCHCTFADLDDEPVGPSFIGRKWLVVVDYHN